MTEELEEAMDLHRQVVSPEDAVNLYSLELLLDVAKNLLTGSDCKDKIVSFLKATIYEEKIKNGK